MLAIHYQVVSKFSIYFLTLIWVAVGGKLSPFPVGYPKITQGRYKLLLRDTNASQIWYPLLAPIPRHWTKFKQIMSNPLKIKVILMPRPVMVLTWYLDHYLNSKKQNDGVENTENKTKKIFYTALILIFWKKLFVTFLPKIAKLFSKKCWLQQN